tara:strand:- start:52 stop:459 length:408 start_codon:yes stop_codon:yes gene_type:complete
MDLNLNQLKLIRGVLSLKRCYKPYEDRGELNTPKGALWNDDMEDLFIQVEAEIMRRFPKCPPWSPYGQFSSIIKESKEFNRKMTQKTLTQDDWNLINTVFSSAAALDVDTRLDDDGDFTVDQFSQVWDKVIAQVN